MDTRKFITIVLILISVRLFASDTVMVDNIQMTKTKQIVDLELKVNFYQDSFSYTDIMKSNVYEFTRYDWNENEIKVNILNKYKGFYVSNEVCYFWLCYDRYNNPEMVLWSDDKKFVFRYDIDINFKDCGDYFHFKFNENNIEVELKIFKYTA